MQRYYIVDSEISSTQYMERVIIKNLPDCQSLGHSFDGKRFFNKINEDSSFLKKIDLLFVNPKLADMSGIDLIKKIQQKYININICILINEKVKPFFQNDISKLDVLGEIIYPANEEYIINCVKTFFIKAEDKKVSKDYVGNFLQKTKGKNKVETNIEKKINDGVLNIDEKNFDFENISIDEMIKKIKVMFPSAEDTVLKESSDNKKPPSDDSDDGLKEDILKTYDTKSSLVEGEGNLENGGKDAVPTEPVEEKIEAYAKYEGENPENNSEKDADEFNFKDENSENIITGIEGGFFQEEDKKEEKNDESEFIESDFLKGKYFDVDKLNLKYGEVNRNVEDNDEISVVPYTEAIASSETAEEGINISDADESEGIKGSPKGSSSIETEEYGGVVNEAEEIQKDDSTLPIEDKYDNERKNEASLSENPSGTKQGDVSLSNFENLITKYSVKKDNSQDSKSSLSDGNKKRISKIYGVEESKKINPMPEVRRKNDYKESDIEDNDSLKDIKEFARSIIAVYSTKGGIGKTTTVCNLSINLSKYSNKKICVVDFDLSNPNLHVHLGNMNPAFDLAKLVSVKNDLDSRIMSSIIMKYTGEDSDGNPVKFDYIAGYVSDYYVYERFNSQDVNNILSILSDMYDIVIIDTNPHYSDEAINAILTKSTKIIFLTSQESTSIDGASNFMSMLTKYKIPLEKLIMVVNKYSNDDSRIPVYKLEEALHLKTSIKVPNEDVMIMKSINTFTPIAISSPDSALNKAFINLAKRIEPSIADKVNGQKKKSFFKR